MCWGTCSRRSWAAIGRVRASLFQRVNWIQSIGICRCVLSPREHASLFSICTGSNIGSWSSRVFGCQSGSKAQPWALILLRLPRVWFGKLFLSYQGPRSQKRSPCQILGSEAPHRLGYMVRDIWKIQLQWSQQTLEKPQMSSSLDGLAH